MHQKYAASEIERSRDAKIVFFPTCTCTCTFCAELIFMRLSHRIRRNERSAMAEDESREEQHHPSILVRQIQRTRDKNLRIVLLERELRVRSPKRDARLIANGINIRQLSSPLCWFLSRCKKQTETGWKKSGFVYIRQFGSIMSSLRFYGNGNVSAKVSNMLIISSISRDFSKTCKIREFNRGCDLTRRRAIRHCRTFLSLRRLPLHRFDIGFVEHLEMRMSADYLRFRYSNHEHSLSFGSLLARLVACFLPSASYRLWTRSFFYGKRYADNEAISFIIGYVYTIKTALKND